MTETILVDTREKVPLPFPDHLVVRRGARTTTLKIETVKRTLTTADYVLASAPDAVGIERKGSLREVATNCLTGDRRRFIDCLARLRDSFRHPILLLEGTPTLLRRPLPGRVQPGEALDALLSLLHEYGVRLELVQSGSYPQRRALGWYAAHLLIMGAMQ